MFHLKQYKVYSERKAGLRYLQGSCYVVVVMKISLVTLTAGNLLANLVLLKKKYGKSKVMQSVNPKSFILARLLYCVNFYYCGEQTSFGAKGLANELPLSNTTLEGSRPRLPVSFNLEDKQFSFMGFGKTVGRVVILSQCHF